MKSIAGVPVDGRNFSQPLSQLACLLLLLLWGCGEDEQSGPEVDASVPMPDQMLVTDTSFEVDSAPQDAGLPADTGLARLGEDDPLPSNAFTVVDDWLARWSVLFDGRIVGQIGEDIFLYDDGSNQLVGSELGDLVVARSAGVEILILTDQGLFVLGPEGLELSPVDELVNDLIGLSEDNDGGVWLMSDEQVSRWHDGQLRSVELPALNIPYDAARYTVGQYRGQPVLWLAADRVLAAVGTESAWRFEWPDHIQWMTATADGVWVASGNELHLIDDQGDSRVWIRPEQSRIGVGVATNAALWMSSGLDLVHWDGEQLTTRTEVPDHVGLQVDGSGAAYLANLAGIHRVLPGRVIEFIGLRMGDRLVRETDVNIDPSSPEQVSEITAQVDMGDVTVITGPPWRVTLEPNAVGPGSHTLRINIRYTDNITISETLDFVGPPTWAADIQPLYEAQCAACHGEGGSAHPMADITAWQNEIVAIIDDIETGRMPYGLPRLSADQLQVVMDWQTSGFLEQ